MLTRLQLLNSSSHLRNERPIDLMIDGSAALGGLEGQRFTKNHFNWFPARQVFTFGQSLVGAVDKSWNNGCSRFVREQAEAGFERL